MSYQLKEGQGSLFKNVNKKAPAQPDWTGNVMINGQEMRVAAWVKEGKGGKFFSLQVSENEKAKEQSTTSDDDDGLF
jgi:hypothetical protein